jgi:hypothetical protein
MAAQTAEHKISTLKRGIVTLTLAGMLTTDPIAPRLEAQGNGSCTERSSISLIQKRLSETELNRYFGIGNPTPSDAKTYSIGKGWQGEGIYFFVDGKTTCYLNTAKQLDNWYFAKHYPKERDAPEKNGELQPPDPEVRKIESKVHSRKSSMLRGVGGIVERPGKALGGISPIGVGAQKGPVHAGAATPGVEVGGAGTITPPTKAPDTAPNPNPAAVQTTNVPATALTPADKIERLRHVLAPDQLQNYLGIGNMTPYGVRTYSQSGGWQGEGIYNFDREKFSTPPLSRREQLGVWYYVIYGQAERAEELAGQPLDPAIKSAVDNLR